jgi:tetratricopeptide (TPR) repeat protein
MPMRLDFHVPSSWPAELPLRSFGLELLPDDQQAWVRRTLIEDAPPARLVVGADETTTTAAGWPLRIVEARLEGADGAVIEHRLAAFYAFFEHAATVLARCADGPRFAALVPDLRAALAAATPVWTDEPAALAQLWDVRAARAPAAAALPRVPDPDADPDAAPQPAPTPTPAPLIDPDTIAAWEAAAAADPTEVDALYDAGVAHYLRRDFEAALACWSRASARAPGDFGVAKKLVQAQHALGRYDDAAAARRRLRELWRTSADPAVRLLDEVVIDQFEVDGASVHAFETLRPRSRDAHALLSFRVIGHAGPPVTVAVETSAYGRERGAPFVLSRTRGPAYEVIGASDQLPAYADLRATATGLIRDALAAT